MHFLLTLVALVYILCPTPVLAALGSYSGRFGVGTADIEIPVTSPSNVTDTTHLNGTYAFRLDTVYFTLYYPTDQNAVSSKPQHPWLASPADLIAQGLTRADNGAVPAELIQVGFSSFAANLSIPAQVDTSLVAENSSLGALPVLLFSHGNPTMSQWYSQLYGELATRGIVVVAVTHRDGSSPATIVNIGNGTIYDVVGFTQAQVNGNLSFDEFHARQLQMRQAELNQITAVLDMINSGNGSTITEKNSRKEGLDLQNWSNRLDLKNLVVSGHSFGGNTVLNYLNQTNLAHPAGAALAYDPGKDSGPFPASNITVPLLFADSTEWSAVPSDFYGQSHFDVVRNTAQAALRNTDAAWHLSLLGTVHSSLTDVGLIAASFAMFFTNYTQFIQLDARAAILDYANVTESFIAYVRSRSAADLGPVLGGGVTFPAFRLLPNASGLANPWEVHVAPNATYISSSAASRIEISGSTFMMVSCVVTYLSYIGMFFT